MTHHRTPGTIEAVLLDTLNSLTPAEVGEFTGKTADHFYKVANPTTRVALHMGDAANLDAALIARGDMPVFLPLLAQLAELKARRMNGRSPRCRDLGGGLRRLVVEVGRLHKAADDAMDDNQIDLQERRIVAAHAQDVMDEAQAIRDAVEPNAGEVMNFGGRA